MRKIVLLLASHIALVAYANPPFLLDPNTHTSEIPELAQRYKDREKTIFESGISVRSFDVEEDHIWAAKRWADILTNPVLSEHDFVDLLWINGQQLSALQRQNKIYVRSKGSPKWASFVFEKDFEQNLKRFCAMAADQKACIASLKEKAIKVTEVFWTQFKKEAEEDFKRNQLNPKRIGMHQIRGHIRDAYRNPGSPAWQAINEYLQAVKEVNPVALNPITELSPVVVSASPLIPQILPNPVNHVAKERASLKSRLAAAKKSFVRTLGLEPNIRNVTEERKPWNYVGSNSAAADLSRATSRYSDKIVQSLGCDYFDESSLLNGQIIARLLRQGTTDVAQLTQRTNRAVENWCYAQFANASQIIECKNRVSPLLAELNKYYWQEIKKELESGKRGLSSSDVDSYFADLRKAKASANPEHPLGAIHTRLNNALESIKSDWPYRCLAVKDEALGDYRILKATEEEKIIADNLLKHLIARPLREPPGSCGRAVKVAMDAAGLFKSYPGWNHAKEFSPAFEKENIEHEFLKEGYEYQRLGTLDPDEAPAYAVIVYGGFPSGHVEVKVPTSELTSRGIHKMLAYGKKEINVADRDFAYVSDYIDSAPRSSPKSRIARGDGSNNGRPVIGIYVIMRKS